KFSTMVRTYVRKSQRAKTYTHDQLLEAMNEVKLGRRTVAQASRIYAIPINTLIDHIKGRRGKLSSTFGRPTALTLQDESKLADYLRKLEKHGFGLSRREVMDLVGEYVNSNKIKTPFKDGIPHKDWLTAFMRRQNLSVKNPENIEIARRKSIDPFLINQYFILLKETVDKLGIADKPQLIWNLDETSFCSDPSKTKVVGKKGAKSTRTTAGPGRENTTVLFACSASGVKAPPLIIFKGKQLWTHMISDSAYPGTTYAATPNGWMQSADVFERYIEGAFVQAIGSERPVLLVYDGHVTHISLAVIEKAENAGITILKLPPHSSHVLQPLDLSVMKAIKNKWDPDLVKWQRKNIGVKLPKAEFSKMIGQIWNDIPPLIITNGFRKAGIFPIDNSVIPEDMYDPEALKRWKNSSNEEQAVTESSAAIPSTSHDVPANSFGKPLVKETVATEHPVAIPSTSHIVPVTPFEEQLVEEPSTSFEDLLLSRIKRGSTEKPKRKRICEGAEIITSEEVKQKLIEQEESKKREKRKKKTKKGNEDENENESLHEDQHTEIEFADSSGDEDLISMIEQSNQLEMDTRFHEKRVEDREIGDWVLVQFCTKKTKKHYVGEITSLGLEPLIRFLRKKKTLPSATVFVAPSAED
ncbi:hypothetical protein PPYR_14930, partial [Photinus pyralis]